MHVKMFAIYVMPAFEPLTHACRSQQAAQQMNIMKPSTDGAP